MTAAWLEAQEVQMSSGEVLAGEVVGVEDNRAKIRGADGKLRLVDVRRIDNARAADGTTKRFAAKLIDGPMSADATRALERLESGEALAPPELFQLTERCNRDAFAKLEQLAASDKRAVRQCAAQALAMAATPETVKAALEAALADSDPGLLREVGSLVGHGAALAAVEEAGATELLEKGMASKDQKARFGFAWAAARLGSDEALPVLATFLTDRDHHARESAAMALAERGDDAGAKILIEIAKRKRAPAEAANRGADDETKALVARMVLRERVRACELLGRLKCDEATSSLRALLRSKEPELAAAAERALAQIDG
jgi:HEAT repeat protein